MVYCCVPQCGTDSWRCDPSITFHDFPSSPDLAAKWIQQINTAIKSDHMWFPRGNSMICSKHFLSTDFREDSDSLKPRVVPTVFGYKYIGLTPDVENKVIPPSNDDSSGPLIVKIKTEDGGNQDIIIPITPDLDAIINEPENLSPKDSSVSANTVSSPRYRPYHRPNMGVKHQRFNPMSPKVSTPKKVSNTPSKTVEKIQSTAKTVQKRDNNDNLIEIGPNTFLKINPEIIKVNKKLTPSGNTVLQFLMDQNLANTIGPDVLPKIVQGAISNIGEATNSVKNISVDSSKSGSPKQDVQHVLGHIVDTHVCEESCAKLHEIDKMLMNTDGSPHVKHKTLSKGKTLLDKNTVQTSFSNQKETENMLNNSTTSVVDNEATVANDSIAKAPVLLTTNMSLAHCFMEKTKYLSHLRQKSRQIVSLRQKLSYLNKKMEELETKCIVQERQLSLSFLKKLKAIKKNASRNDPQATYILEQIRAYAGIKQMRWSDSTLHQCAIWCKKAPYAYEYFKKADFFKLPSIGTVKRFIKKHPEMTFTNKAVSNTNNEEDDSSSDFDFDDEESMDDEDNDDETEKIVCETVLSEENNNLEQQLSHENNAIMNEETANAKNNDTQIEVNSEIVGSVHNIKVENASEAKSIQIDGNNLELQELVLPSGEVVQCYGSNLSNQYYIIPSSEDINSGVESEYSIVQSADSVPVILRNPDGTEVHQEQLIFITNSSEQVDCPETEVVTDR